MRIGFNKKPESPRPGPVVDPDPVYCQKCGEELVRQTIFQFDRFTGEQVPKDLYLDCPDEIREIATVFEHDHWDRDYNEPTWWPLRYGYNYVSPRVNTGIRS